MLFPLYIPHFSQLCTHSYAVCWSTGISFSGMKILSEETKHWRSSVVILKTTPKASHPDQGNIRECNLPNCLLGNRLSTLLYKTAALSINRANKWQDLCSGLLYLHACAVSWKHSIGWNISCFFRYNTQTMQANEREYQQWQQTFSAKRLMLSPLSCPSTWLHSQLTGCTCASLAVIRPYLLLQKLLTLLSSFVS